MCSPVKIVFFGGTLRKLWQIQPEHWHMAAFPPHSGCAYWTTLLSRLSWWLPPGRFLDPCSVYFTHSISLLGSSGSDSVQNFSWDIFSWRCRLEEWSWAHYRKTQQTGEPVESRCPLHEFPRACLHHISIWSKTVFSLLQSLEHADCGTDGRAAGVAA